MECGGCMWECVRCGRMEVCGCRCVRCSKCEVCVECVRCGCGVEVCKELRWRGVCVCLMLTTCNANTGGMCSVRWWRVSVFVYIYVNYMCMQPIIRLPQSEVITPFMSFQLNLWRTDRTIVLHVPYSRYSSRG